MNLPPGSNGFFLAGEFEGPFGMASNGWRQRLQRHFTHRLPVSEQAIFQDENCSGAHWYASYVVDKFSICRNFSGPHREGADNHIRDHEKPLYFRATGSFKKLASLATFGSVWTVDDALRSFIEWLEPGVHTFVPIDVKRGGDADPIGTRHILVVEPRIDTFSEVQSHPDSFKITTDRQHVSHEQRASSMRHLAFRRDKIGDAHLWIEPRFSKYLLCMSDRLRAEIVDAGLRIPRHWPMMEV